MWAVGLATFLWVVVAWGGGDWEVAATLVC